MSDKKSLEDMNLEELKLDKQNYVNWVKYNMNREPKQCTLNIYDILMKLEEIKELSKNTDRILFSERKALNSKLQEISKIVQGCYNI